MSLPTRAIALLTLVAGCGAEADDAPLALARPVTVLELQETSPPPDRLFPGVVEPYRQVRLPFEVAGRVEWLADVGDDVFGDQEDRDGNVLRTGTVLARLDPDPLQRALNRAEQRLASAKLQLEAQVVQLETVLPARLESARSRAQAAELNESFARDDVKALESAVQLAETTLERNRELLPTGAVSDIAVRRSETEVQAQQSRLAQARTLVATRQREYEGALSAVAELQGSIALQRANNEAQRAAVKELEEAVLDARSDLEDCELRAPFPGRLTELHVGEGSYVRAGDPIVTLTMMNPIEAVVSVSADLERQLVVGSDAVIYPTDGAAADLTSGVRATLYQKRGIASTSTRTFEVGLIAPNERRDDDDDPSGLASAPYVLPIFENPLDLPGEDGLFTLEEAVGRTGDESWVLRVVGLTQGGRSAETLEGELEAERVPVVLGSRTIQVASFALVELERCPGLGPGDLLVPEPTPEHEAGFVIVDNRWLLRPGDVVQIALDQGRLPTGLWVPVTAIRERNGVTSVFVVDDSDVAHEILVAVHESTGERRRVEADGLDAGSRVVLAGAHFLQDGDAVIVTGAAR